MTVIVKKVFSPTIKRLFTLCLLTAALIACSPSEDKQALAPLLEGIGSLHVPISTELELTQRYFNQGMTFYYAFNHAEAERAFREALRLDPECAICYWGIALTLGPNYNQPMPEQNNEPAWQALGRAVQNNHFADLREQQLMNALAGRYKPNWQGDRRELDLDYMERMKALSEMYQDDVDVLTLYAESMMILHPWQLYDAQGNPGVYTEEIIATLERAIDLNPNHPGALHYYIHAMEPSDQAGRALVAANVLGSLVPVSGHLVHMPAHVYLRLGRYEEAILASEAATDADDLYLSQGMVQGFSADPYYPHNLHFLWYAAMATGQRERALAAAQEMFANSLEDQYSTITLLTAVRFGLWQQVVDLAEELEGLHTERITDTTAIPFHFSKAVALAKMAQFDQAQQQIENIDTAVEVAGQDTDLNKIYRLLASAVLAGERGQIDRKIAELEQAVQLQDGLPYSEPPQFFYPIRQSLGLAYLENGQETEAIDSYRIDLQMNPNTAWSILGMLNATENSGNRLARMMLPTRLEEALEFFTFELTTPSYL